jgi:hypothetical protein
MVYTCLFTWYKYTSHSSTIVWYISTKILASSVHELVFPSATKSNFVHTQCKNTFVRGGQVPSWNLKFSRRGCASDATCDIYIHHLHISIPKKYPRQSSTILSIRRGYRTHLLETGLLDTETGLLDTETGLQDWKNQFLTTIYQGDFMI